jgi:hypothetical protein
MVMLPQKWFSKLLPEENYFLIKYILAESLQWTMWVVLLMVQRVIERVWSPEKLATRPTSTWCQYPKAKSTLNMYHHGNLKISF